MSLLKFSSAASRSITLNANLVEYLRLAKSNSAQPVNLQSNAVRRADPALARAIAETGLAEVFISLHGSTSEISDAITEAPGTFDKTLVGIDNIYREGVRVLLNFVSDLRGSARAAIPHRRDNAPRPLHR